MDDQTYLTIFKPRGIARDIADDEDRYIRIDRAEKGWRERLLDADPAFRQHTRRAVRRIGPVAGIVMRKHPVPLPDLERIVSQCRADVPASQGKMDPHWHGDLSLATHRFHVRGRYHEGIEDPTAHIHERNDGKYMMWPAPKVSWDRPTIHLNYGRVDSLAEHLLNQHDADLADPDYVARAWRPHRHPGLMKDPNASPEKRLDMYPAVAARLVHGDFDRVFFVIEGVLKADALVSAGEVAFDVPSVTVWDAEELEPFTEKYLAGVPVYVVPDSDWAGNPQVAVQAFAARDALVRYGAVAQVAAPTPEPSYCRRHRAPKGAKRGVDDFLGDRQPVDGMLVLLREPTPAFKAWKWHRLNTAVGDARERQADVAVLEWMVLHAAKDGTVAKSARQIATYTATGTVKIVHSKAQDKDIEVKSTDRVRGAVERLLAGGELTTDDPLVHRDQFTRLKLKDGRPDKWIGTGEDWSKVPDGDLGKRLPEFTIRADLRSREDPVTIADWEHSRDTAP